MKFTRTNFEMQRFESFRLNQPVRLKRVKYEGRQKPRGIASFPDLHTPSAQVSSGPKTDISTSRNCSRNTAKPFNQAAASGCFLHVPSAEGLCETGVRPSDRRYHLKPHDGARAAPGSG